jgi:hypothetical protein
MQHSWLKQLLIGLALFLAGYFMFGGAQMSQETKDKVSVINSLMIVA